MLYIYGEWVQATSGATFSSFNPATGADLGPVADAGAADARRAIAAADQAFGEWSGLTAYQRSAHLYEAWRIMTERRERLARLMTEEQGKPLRMARNEVTYAADFLLWFAEEAKRIYGETIPSARADQRFITLRQPVGVAAAITPWNYPISMITRKIAPGAGRRVHHRGQAGGTDAAVRRRDLPGFPRCGLSRRRGQPAHRAPSPAVAAEFLDNWTVRKITFTGSTEVGKHIAGAAARQLKRVSLELGGHAPFMVFDDADPVHAARGAALVKFLNTGQACICPEPALRAPVAGRPLPGRLTERVAKLQAGNGLDDGVTVGPLIDEPAMAKMEAQVADATSQGATVVCGGRRLHGESFRSRPVLRAYGAGRRHPGHAYLPGGDLRSDRTRDRVRRRGRCARDGQRHHLRAGVLPLHPGYLGGPFVSPSGSTSGSSESMTSTRLPPPCPLAVSKRAASGGKAPVRAS